MADQNKFNTLMPEEFESNLFSVIIPTYNRAHVLQEALDSVLSQTYRPIELLIVDDGSQDNTYEMVDHWIREQHQYPEFRIQYLFQENQGAPAARNLGLLRSHGEYIQFLDSDDILYPDMLSKSRLAFIETGCDVVHVGYEKLCSECGKYLYRYVPDAIDDMLCGYMTGRLWGNTSSLIRRRDLARAIGPWNESLPIDQDGDYMCRTVLQPVKMAVVQALLFGYMVRPFEKINDIRHSARAWQCKVKREAMFCAGIENKKNLPMHARKAYAGHLYTRAVQLCAVGMSDIGNAYGQLAEGVQAPSLTWQARKMSALWKCGEHVCRAYNRLQSINRLVKDRLKGRKPSTVVCQCCGR